MKFHIPEPCHEKWDEMTPTEKGAFCDKCALEVTDFTKKSPYEIRELLTEKLQNIERACGHITHRQLNDVNDIGFYWKNEQHRFQSAWMVSLLAVFGMTLFSCQNTYTKEMVSKMETEAQALLHEDTLGINTAKEDVEIDSSLTTAVPKEVALDGLISLENLGGDTSESLITCTVILGDIIYITGATGIIPEEDKDQNELFSAFAPIYYNTPQGEQVAPWPNRNNLGARADIVFDEETDDFIAYISPTPLSLESKLIIESFLNGEVYLTLENVRNQQVYSSKNLEVSKGIHRFNLGLDKTPPGDYQIELHSRRTAQTIQYRWEGAMADPT